jgi:DNA-binding MarR family transcriptional regulator
MGGAAIFDSTGGNSMSDLWYKAQGGFFCLPRALRHDDRLSHPDLRVLLALASHVFQNNDVFPCRESLYRLTGIGVSNISKRTRRLEKFGWLSKSGKRGKSVTYSLRVPEYAVARMANERLAKVSRADQPTSKEVVSDQVTSKEIRMSSTSDDSLWDHQRPSLDFDGAPV